MQSFDTFEQGIAVRLFRQGLKPLATDLIVAIEEYREAEAAFQKAEEKRNRVVKDYKSVLSLIKKAGGQVEEEEASLADFEINTPRQQSNPEAKAHFPEPQTSNKTEEKPPFIIRNEIVEALRASNKFQTANDVVELTRKRLGIQIPDSTITSSLSVQWKAGKVLRFQSPNRTNMYGVAEWFHDGKPKQEFLGNQQMSIEN